MKPAISLVIISCVVVLFSASPVLADGSTLANSAALKGLSEVKVYFDVTEGKGEVLLARMDLIEKTLKQLTQEGIAVTAVVGFRAGASIYVTAGEHYVLEEEIPTKLKIGEWVQQFAENGVTVEQCSIAAAQQGITATDFLPEVTVVQNGFVSLIGYQTNGFAVIPIY